MKVPDDVQQLLHEEAHKIDELRSRAKARSESLAMSAIVQEHNLGSPSSDRTTALMLHAQAEVYKEIIQRIDHLSRSGETL